MECCTADLYENGDFPDVPRKSAMTLKSLYIEIEPPFTIHGKWEKVQKKGN